MKTAYLVISAIIILVVFFYAFNLLKGELGNEKMMSKNKHGMHEKPEHIIINKYIENLDRGIGFYYYDYCYLPNIATCINTEIENIEFTYPSFDKVNVKIIFKNSLDDGINIERTYAAEEEWKLKVYNKPEEYSKLFPFISIFFKQNPNVNDLNPYGKITNISLVDENNNKISYKKDINRIIYLPDSYYKLYTYPKEKSDFYKFYAGHNVLLNIPLKDKRYVLTFTIDDYKQQFYDGGKEIIFRIPILFCSKKVTIKGYRVVTSYEKKISSQLFRHSETRYPIDRVDTNTKSGKSIQGINTLGERIYFGDKVTALKPKKSTYEGLLLMFNEHKLTLKSGLNVGIKKSNSPIPLSIYDLLKKNKNVLVPPILEYFLINKNKSPLTVQVKTEILELSHPDIRNVILQPQKLERINFIPTFISTKTETLLRPQDYTILSVIKNTETSKILHENTEIIRILPYDTMLWRMIDESIGKVQWYDDYIINWVRRFKSKQLDNVLTRCLDYVYDRSLCGYDESKFSKAIAENQFQSKKEFVRNIVEALYNSLNEHNPKYSDESLDLGRTSNQLGQRIKYPKETLEQKRGNCIDSTVMFASILEMIGLNSVIVIIRSPQEGHAFIGWETWNDSNEFEFLEVTCLGYNPFNVAYGLGMRKENEYSADSIKKHYMKKIYLKKLREEGIYSLELAP